MAGTGGAQLQTVERPRRTAVAPRVHSLPREFPASGRRLRRALVGLDVAALVVAVIVGVAFSSAAWNITTVVLMLLLVVAGTAANRVQQLYKARVASVRTTEVNGLFRTSVALAALAFLGAELLEVDVSAVAAIVLGAAAFVLLAFGRSQYSAWIALARRSGKYLRPVVIVGANGEAEELARLFEDHTELGYAVVGVAGAGAARPAWVGAQPYSADIDDVLEFVGHVGANGVVISATGIDATASNRMVRDLLRAGIHVQYSCGLQGISTRRMRAVPLGHEPLFYLEPIPTSYVRRVLKRGVDIVGSSVLLLLTAPLMAVAAAAVKLQDRGPVLFRQQRVGLHGQHFEMLKLRTMRPNAEADDALAATQNDRDGGPLFKNADDPRRTRVGRFLERVSLDELPQLANVLRGDMSLVGPRPALPAQVEAFDDELLTRHTMRPGVTGLWQLEARDNPSFRAYRRLDLFYVENWSIGLDIAILLGTVGAVLGRRSKP